jgi:hypothetical protein
VLVSVVVMVPMSLSTVTKEAGPHSWRLVGLMLDRRHTQRIFSLKKRRNKPLERLLRSDEVGTNCKMPETFNVSPSDP